MSTTKEALELLSLSPCHGASSRHLGCDAQELSSSSRVGSDLFKDWPKANCTAVSVYVALTTEPSSSRPPVATAPHSEQRSDARGSSTQWPCSQAAAL
jgi:hypothetical protein